MNTKDLEKRVREITEKLDIENIVHIIKERKEKQAV